MPGPEIQQEYAALCEAGQLLYRRLGVFNSSWTSAGARAVCSDKHLTESDVDRFLKQFEEKKVVASCGSPPRFRFLGGREEFARREFSDANDRESTTASLVTWSRSLATLVAGNVHGADQALWLSLVDAEYENILGAIESCRADPVAALELAVALIRYWMIRGKYEEGLGWLESTRRACPPAGSENLHGMALVGQANLCWLMGDVAAARLHYVQAAESGLTNDPEVLAPALNGLGNVLVSEGRPEEARVAFVEACSINCLSGNRALEAMNLSNIARTYMLQGDLDNAEDYFGESESINTEIGNVAGLMHSFCMVGYIEYVRADYEKALTYLVISLRHSQELEERALSITGTGLVGAVAWRKGDFALSCALLALAFRLARSIEYEIDPMIQARLDEALAGCQEKLDEEAFESHWGRYRDLTWPCVYETVVNEAKSLQICSR